MESGENCNCPITTTVIHIAKFGIYHIIKDALDTAGSRSFPFVSPQCYLGFWIDMPLLSPFPVSSIEGRMVHFAN